MMFPTKWEAKELLRVSHHMIVDQDCASVTTMWAPQPQDM